MSHIEAAALTTFEVAPDGTRFQMNLVDQDGKSASVSLPARCINELMMTLPNVMRRALSIQFRDSSLRLVYQLGTTRVEKAAGKEAVILTSTTPDGFEGFVRIQWSPGCRTLAGFVGCRPYPE